MPFKDVNYYYEEIEANSDTILNRDIASAVSLNRQYFFKNLS